ncbi:MAG: hypothetical protein K0Q87_3425 [Neobacillus sp.]|jgi:hypothetical protein|nr:hypothetical protein [Neobacillus sp.]
MGVVDANMYHIDVLPDFIKYIHEKWIPKNAGNTAKSEILSLGYLPKLLRKRGGQIVKA